MSVENDFYKKKKFWVISDGKPEIEEALAKDNYEKSCMTCVHLIDEIDGTCKAFPEAIPEYYLLDILHDTIDEDQEGDYVFTKDK